MIILGRGHCGPHLPAADAVAMWLKQLVTAAVGNSSATSQSVLAYVGGGGVGADVCDYDASPHS